VAYYLVYDITDPDQPKPIAGDLEGAKRQAASLAEQWRSDVILESVSNPSKRLRYSLAKGTWSAMTDR